MADVAFALALNLHQPSGNLDDLLERREWEARVRPPGTNVNAPAAINSAVRSGSAVAATRLAASATPRTCASRFLADRQATAPPTRLPAQPAPCRSPHQPKHISAVTRRSGLPPWWFPEWGDRATTEVTVGRIRVERRASTWPGGDQRH